MILAIATVLLAVAYRESEVRRVDADLKRSHIAQATLLGNVIRPILLDGVWASTEYLPSMAAEAELDRTVRLALRGTPAMHLSILDTDGTIIYSTKGRGGRTDADGDRGLRAAITENRPISARHAPAGTSGGGNGASLKTRIETYLPLLGSDGMVRGVMVLESDATTALKTLTRRSWWAAAVLVGGSIFLFAALLALLRWSGARERLRAQGTTTTGRTLPAVTAFAPGFANLGVTSGQLLALLEVNPSPTFVKAADGTLVGCNRAFETLFGYPKTRFLGRTEHDLLPPALADVYQRHDKELLDSVGTRTFEARLMAGEESPRDVIFYKSSLAAPDGTPDGIIGVVVDITPQKQAEMISTQVSAAIEELSEIFAMYDAEDRLVICNKRWRELNQPIADVIRPGVTFEEYLRAAVGRGLIMEALGREEEWIRERLARHRNPRGPFEITRPGGLKLLVLEQRMPDGVTATFTTDISGLKRAEAALKDSEQRHRDFAADAAHELRTPLAVLKLHLDALPVSEATRQIRQDVDAMTRLVEQLLALTRLETMAVEPGETADLRRVCANVAAYLMPLALKDGRSIEVDGTEAPVIIEGNAQMLEQAVRNLLENALRYSERGGSVTLEVRDDATVMVVDQGVGIPREQRETIFERFLRQDRRAGGAGLGLAIVRRTVEAHAGTINITDTPGGGATFVLRFPLLKSAARPPWQAA